MQHYVLLILRHSHLSRKTREKNARKSSRVFRFRAFNARMP